MKDAVRIVALFVIVNKMREPHLTVLLCVVNTLIAVSLLIEHA